MAHVAAYPDWQGAAVLELERRATWMLEGLTDNELRQIADGKINLNDLAKRLPH